MTLTILLFESFFCGFLVPYFARGVLCKPPNQLQCGNGTLEEGEQCEKRGYLNSNDYYHFIASRKETNRILNENFKRELSSSLSDLIKIDICVVLPWMSKGLEVVDAISFAIYQKYEFGNLDLYSVIKNKIILEKQIRSPESLLMNKATDTYDAVKKFANFVYKDSKGENGSIIYQRVKRYVGNDD